jgi:hypothetical protein
MVNGVDTEGLEGYLLRGSLLFFRIVVNTSLDAAAKTPVFDAPEKQKGDPLEVRSTSARFLAPARPATEAEKKQGPERALQILGLLSVVVVAVRRQRN